MKSGKLMCITALTLFTLLAISVRLTAQANQDHKSKHHHYQLIDLGRSAVQRATSRTGSTASTTTTGRPRARRIRPRPIPIRIFVSTQTASFPTTS